MTADVWEPLEVPASMAPECSLVEAVPGGRWCFWFSGGQHWVKRLPDGTWCRVLVFAPRPPLVFELVDEISERWLV